MCDQQPKRDLDFVEVFSGRAHLTGQLREVSWLIAGICRLFICSCVDILDFKKHLD